MFVIIGIVVVICAILAGYLREPGLLSRLSQVKQSRKSSKSRSFPGCANATSKHSVCV
jgi:hypothetical protein